jgi:hypothetical protein
MAFSPVNLNLKMDFTSGGTVWQGFGGSAAMLITDGANTALAATVAQFHNADNQTYTGGYGLMTGGVAQVLNLSGNLDRQRGAWGDGQPATGLQAAVEMLFNGTTFDRQYGSAAGGAWVTVKNGSSGNDYSLNKPAIPNVGAGFGATGTYANYVYLGVILASPTRNEVEVINTSGSQIVLVFDDGSAAAGAAATNASVFALGAGSGVGSQGGAWQSAIFKGRIQIYALSSTAQIMARVA